MIDNNDPVWGVLWQVNSDGGNAMATWKVAGGAIGLMVVRLCVTALGTRLFSLRYEDQHRNCLMFVCRAVSSNAFN